MKLKNIFILLLSVLALVACDEDYLDVTNPNTLTPDQFWQNEDDALKAVTAMYATNQYQVWGGMWGAAEILHMVEAARSDMIYWNIWQPMHGLARYQMSPTSYMNWDLWTIAYQTIFAANQIIENVPNIEDMAADKKDIFVAEAKFIRAHSHFMLLTNFGNIVLVTESAKTPDDFYKVQSPAADVWAQIETDLNEAKGKLPSSWDSQFLGRATKGAATAYLGKAYLYQDKWTEAKNELESVVGMGYDLVDNYASLFDGSNEHSSESIFEVNYTSSREGGRTESISVGGIYREYWSNWVTDYGKELFLNDVNEEGEFSQRFYGTVLWDDPGCDAWYWEGQSYKEYYGDDETKMYWKKWVHNPEHYENEYRTDANYPIIRYSDVLLMLAEAINESGAGQEAQAIAYVNEVRERAGAKPIAAMNQSELREHIRHVERPLEFALEGTRFYDLTRWYGFGKDGGLKALLTSHNRYGVENFVDGESELLPIPQDEIDANPDIIQNKGY